MMMKPYPLQLEISGPTAMWTRPDTGSSPVSYVAPTFSAVKGKTGCTKLDVDLMLQLLKHTYSDTRSVIRTMVEVVHAHTLTHKSRAGSVSDFAFLDALMPKKTANLDKPSESIADYGELPTWEKIMGLAVRAGTKTTFAECGEYRDYAP